MQERGRSGTSTLGFRSRSCVCSPWDEVWHRSTRAHHDELQARGCLRAKLLVAVIVDNSASGRGRCRAFGGVVDAMTPTYVPDRLMVGYAADTGPNTCVER
jgi:hypothetical protein